MQRALGWAFGSPNSPQLRRAVSPSCALPAPCPGQHGTPRALSHPLTPAFMRRCGGGFYPWAREGLNLFLFLPSAQCLPLGLPMVVSVPNLCATALRMYTWPRHAHLGQKLLREVAAPVIG